MRPGQPIRLSATGDVAGAVNGGVCLGVSLAAGTAASSVIVRQNGSGGGILFTLTAAANGNGAVMNIPFAYAGQLHLTIAGTGAEATAFI